MEFLERLPKCWLLRKISNIIIIREQRDRNAEKLRTTVCTHSSAALWPRPYSVHCTSLPLAAILEYDSVASYVVVVEGSHCLPDPHHWTQRLESENDTSMTRHQANPGAGGGGGGSGSCSRGDSVDEVTSRCRVGGLTGGDDHVCDAGKVTGVVTDASGGDRTKGLIKDTKHEATDQSNSTHNNRENKSDQ